LAISNTELELKQLEPYYDEWEPMICKEEYRSPKPFHYSSEVSDSEKHLAWKSATSPGPVRPVFESLYQIVSLISWNICFCFHGDDGYYRR